MSTMQLTYPKRTCLSSSSVSRRIISRLRPRVRSREVEHLGRPDDSELIGRFDWSSQSWLRRLGRPPMTGRDRDIATNGLPPELRGETPTADSCTYFRCH